MNMPFRDARTSTAVNSIWLETPEETFRQHLVQLEERTNAVPIDPRNLPIVDWHTSSPHPYILPIETEQQLADDFASLAAVDEGAQSVAAVCIEEQIHPSRLTLRFAALDLSLHEGIHAALIQASHILSRVADTGFSPEDAIDELLKHVINLHEARLHARLRSVKWEKPKYLTRSHKKPLWRDFANLLHRTQFLYTKQEKGQRQQAEIYIKNLALVYELFEAVFSTVASEHLVRASFMFVNMAEIKDLSSRLENSVTSVPTPQVASAIKCLRQVQKIAAYRRICISLVTTASTYPDLFRHGLKIEYLTSYASTPTSIAYEEWAKTCHVHAEVQLAVHYDLESIGGKKDTFYPPRCIGISKWLCYLCYQFLRAHKQFFPSRTHGRLYDQWTIPDLEEFSDDTRHRYREILKEIDGETLRRIESEPELWRAEPMTSLEIPR